MAPLIVIILGFLIPPAFCANPEGFYAGIGFGAGNSAVETRFENHNKEKGIEEQRPGALYSTVCAGYFKEIGKSKVTLGSDLYLTFNSRNVKGELKVDNSPIEGKYEMKVHYGFGLVGYIGYRININATPFIGAGTESFKIGIRHFDRTFLPQQEVQRKSFKLLHYDIGLMLRVQKRFILFATYQFFPDNKIIVRNLDQNLNANSRYIHHTLREHRLLLKLAYIF